MIDVTVIGNAIMDVIAQPLNEHVFKAWSSPVDQIRLSFGGDALNESVVLSRFGKRVELISKVGQDEAGFQIINYLKDNDILTNKVRIDPKIDTSVNIILTDEHDKRHFLTNPTGSQRKLSLADVKEVLKPTGSIVSFASMFISPLLDIDAMTGLFRMIKEETDSVLAVDMTKAKNGEKLEDLQELLPYIDYLFPNEEEISLLTGNSDPYANAELLIHAGVSCAVIKCENKGSILRYGDHTYHIPAYHVDKCVNTTGAGDSFAAGFIWALSEGKTIFDCGCFASAAASCAVEQIGATEGVRSLKEVLRRYHIIRKEALCAS